MSSRECTGVRYQKRKNANGGKSQSLFIVDIVQTLLFKPRCLFKGTTVLDSKFVLRSCFSVTVIHDINYVLTVYNLGGEFVGRAGLSTHVCK